MGEVLLLGAIFVVSALVVVVVVTGLIWSVAAVSSSVFHWVTDRFDRS